MTDTYSSKQLKREPTQSQNAEDAEVFRLVKRNPTRKVDADTLPPVAMGKDGKLFFTDPTPTLGDTIQAIGGIVLLVLGVFLGVSGVVCALVAGLVNANVLVYCVVGIMSTLAIISLKGEKKNVQQ